MVIVRRHAAVITAATVLRRSHRVAMGFVENDISPFFFE
jgi:hypothetical protein